MPTVITAIIYLMQATWLTSVARGVRRLGLEIAARPFSYSDTPDLELDMFLNFTDSTRYRVCGQCPVYSCIHTRWVSFLCRQSLLLFRCTQLLWWDSCLCWCYYSLCTWSYHLSRLHHCSEVSCKRAATNTLVIAVHLVLHVCSVVHGTCRLI